MDDFISVILILNIVIHIIYEYVLIVIVDAFSNVLLNHAFLHICISLTKLIKHQLMI